MKAKYYIPLYILLFICCYFVADIVNSNKTYAANNANDWFDQQCKEVYGEACIRVRSTQELKNAIDDVFNNLKLGTFYFVTNTETESVNIIEGYNYFFNKYGLSNPNTNEYRYSKKGDWEPYRWRYSDQDLQQYQELGILPIITKDTIRVSKEEKQFTDDYLNKIIPLIIQGARNDAEKAYRVGKFIQNTTTQYSTNFYNNQEGFVYNDTSIYDVFIERNSVCIGVSVAFSYIMDKLGIESYIVDQGSLVDNGRAWSSSHTYNKVVLDGVKYTVDLSSGSFGFNTSGYSSYSTGTQIESIYNNYKNGIPLNYKFYDMPEWNGGSGGGVYIDPGSNVDPGDPNYVVPTMPSMNNNNNNNSGNNNNNNNQNNNNNNTTTPENNNNYNDDDRITTKIIEVTNEQGEVVDTYVVYGAEEINNDGNNNDNHTPTPNQEGGEEVADKQEENKIINKTNLNILLGVLGGILVIVLIVLFIRDKCKCKINMAEL